MILELKKFGTILNSRDFAREAILRTRQIVNGASDTSEPLVLDFNGVEIITPSFAAEFMQGLKTQYPNKELRVVGVKDNSILGDVLQFIKTDSA